MMKKLLWTTALVMLCYLTSVYAQTPYTGYYRTVQGNTEYHHFTRNHSEGTAVYINQESTGPILRLSSGTYAANNNVKFSFESNGRLGIGTKTPVALLSLGSNSYTTSTPLENPEALLRFDNTFDSEGEASANKIVFYQNSSFKGGIGISSSDVDLFSGQNFKFYTQHTPTSEGYNAFSILQDGKVGIGINQPKSKVHIQSGASGGTPHDYSKLTIEGSDKTMISVLTPNNKMGFIGFADTDDNWVAGLEYSHSTDVLGIQVNDQDQLFINKDGQVGIGISSFSTDYKLAVDGKIIAEGLKIEMSKAWPDYVFASSYNLRPLSEVKKFIEENSHLPEVPSAKDVEENGVDVGQMDAILLQKIEEMTLYMIQLEEKNAELEKRINELEKK